MSKIAENDKPTYKDIFDINMKYLEYLLAKSYLSHQYLKNIKLTGDQVESEFRKILSALLPKRYKVTHGYIASAPYKKTEPSVSPQIDIIIVDTLVPHSIFMIEENGMELVPLESVVAFFEVKRTIDPDVLDKALDHLYNTQVQLNIDKTNSKTYFPAGVQNIGILYSNPLIGILSLTHKEFENVKEYENKYGEKIKNRISNNKMPDLDIWASLGSLVMATCNSEDHKMLWAYTLREEEKKYPYLFKLKGESDLSQAYFLSISLGFILFYISNITGRMANLENYFCNEKI